ncbi:MAG: hypothetical protein EXR69_10670 [Myxococcales bacterium]|nr:hypothetical protein [Myxococcales bacterium]
MSEIDRLRSARRSFAPGVGGGTCPSAERLYDAATGALSPGEVSASVDHAGTCVGCSADWALVRASLPVENARVPARRVGVALGALAALAAGVALWVQTPPPAGPLVFRALEPSGPSWMIPDGGALPRAAFRLEWAPGPPGSTHSVVVGDEAGRPIYRVSGLETAFVSIPASALAALADGAVVVWQVEETRADGSAHRSPANRSLIR